ncbi:MAG: GtrA family protein [Pontiellaceae bacterium]|nr:GtrA family protein [Pontiellaceae bacterium]
MQLIKYIFCGGISIGVDAVAFYILAWLVFPCLQFDDPAARILRWMGFAVREVSKEELIRNYWVVKSICFVLSNGVVYILNVLFVFESGRHHRVKEMLLFFSISTLVFYGGTVLGEKLITQFGWQMTYTYVFVLSLGIVLNFLLRKIVVFKY